MFTIHGWDRDGGPTGAHWRMNCTSLIGVEFRRTPASRLVSPFSFSHDPVSGRRNGSPGMTNLTLSRYSAIPHAMLRRLVTTKVWLYVLEAAADPKVVDQVLLFLPETAGEHAGSFAAITGDLFRCGSFTHPL